MGAEKIWDGVTQAFTLKEGVLNLRNKLADDAKFLKWDSVFNILADNKDLINSWRPGGKTFYTPLHQAAYCGVDIKIVQDLIKLGAWRSLKTSRNELSYEIAKRKGHGHLIEILLPIYKFNVSREMVEKIQVNFHEIIQSRAGKLINEHQLRLPELSPLCEFKNQIFYFPIPGLYGGFRYWFEGKDMDAYLISESWSRVEGGSGERYIHSGYGSLLINKGFV